MKPSRLLSLLCALALLLPGAAQAERYRVDLILFADKTGTGGESPEPPRMPELKAALEPADTAQLRAAGIELLPDERFGLVEEWKRLRNSRNHQPLLRLAWLQKDPPAERGPRLRLRWGSPAPELAAGGGPPVYPVDGSVALLVGRFLHLDADLVYSMLGPDGTPGSYRLQERRRLRREELHHLDSPKLGLLVRAQRAPEPAAPTPPKATPKQKPGQS